MRVRFVTGFADEIVNIIVTIIVTYYYDDFIFKRVNGM